jgi:hypothetical protein
MNSLIERQVMWYVAARNWTDPTLGKAVGIVPPDWSGRTPLRSVSHRGPKRSGVSCAEPYLLGLL